MASIDRTISERPGYEDEPGCESYFDCHYEVICEFIGDMVIPETCGEPELISKVWSHTICPDDDTPPGTTDCADVLNFDHPDCQTNNNQNQTYINWGEFGVFGYTDEEVTTIEANNDIGRYKTKYVNAIIYVAGSTANFRTYEKIELVKYIPLIGRWLITSVEHENMSVEGYLIDISLEPIINYTNGSFYNSTVQNTNNNSYFIDSYAKMEYSFKDKRTKIIDGKSVTRYSNDITGSRKWTLSDMGISAND